MQYSCCYIPFLCIRNFLFIDYIQEYEIWNVDVNVPTNCIWNIVDMLEQLPSTWAGDFRKCVDDKLNMDKINVNILIIIIIIIIISSWKKYNYTINTV